MAIILLIIYNTQTIFWSFSVAIIIMNSSFLAPLPATRSERDFSLSGQLVHVQSDAQLELLPADAPKTSEAPVI